MPGLILRLNVKVGDSVKKNDEIVVMEAMKMEAQPAVQSAPAPAPSAPVSGGHTVSAPMPGLILRLNVKKGDSVKENDEIVIMEAMKMENPIYAPCSGVIADILVSQGDQLQADDPILVIA